MTPRIEGARPIEGDNGVKEAPFSSVRGTGPDNPERPAAEPGGTTIWATALEGKPTAERTNERRTSNPRRVVFIMYMIPPAAFWDPGPTSLNGPSKRPMSSGTGAWRL